MFRCRQVGENTDKQLQARWYDFLVCCYPSQYPKLCCFDHQGYLHDNFSVQRILVLLGIVSDGDITKHRGVLCSYKATAIDFIL